MKRQHVLAIAFGAALLAGLAIANGTAASVAPKSEPAAVLPVAIPNSQARFTIRRLEGDVTSDCRVKIDDMQQIANRYLATRGTLLYLTPYDVGLPTPNGVIDIQDLQFVFGRLNSTCADPIPAQPPVALQGVPQSGDVTLTKSPDTANIWICTPGEGDCGSAVPNQIDASNWQNGIVVDEVITINSPVANINEYAFDLIYDPSLLQPPTIEDQGVLGAGTTCTLNHVTAARVAFHCTTTGPGVTWSGPKTVAKVTFVLQPSDDDIIRAAKENGVPTDIFDTGANVNEPTATPTSTATAVPTSTDTPTATSTPITPSPTGTPKTPTPSNTPGTPQPTSTPVTPAPSSTPVTPGATGTPVTPKPTRTPTPAACIERTEGYWRNHPDAWPVDALTLGSRRYTKAELLAILKTPTGGDASLILAHQLIAAKLNVAAGADYSAPGSITLGDGVLAKYAGALPYSVAPSSPDGQSMVLLGAQLDEANSICEGTPPEVTSPTPVNTVLSSTRRTGPLGLPFTGQPGKLGSDAADWVIAGMSLVIVSLLVVLARQAIGGKERDE